MSSWDITPASVSSILESEKSLAETELTNALNGVSTETGSAIDTCTTATPLSENGEAPLVAIAVAEWLQTHETELTGLGTTVVNVVSNTASAVQSYLDQDEEAALEFQRAAK